MEENSKSQGGDGVNDAVSGTNSAPNNQSDSGDYLAHSEVLKNLSIKIHNLGRLVVTVTATNQEHSS